MGTRIGIALAAALVVCASSHAMAQRITLNDDAAPAVATEVAWREAPQSSHARPRQSRNVGLGNGGYIDRGVPGGGVGDDNYRYWHQACCQ